MDREQLFQRFRNFAEIETPRSSPLYERLSWKIMEDESLLELSSASGAGQPPPNLLFATDRRVWTVTCSKPISYRFQQDIVNGGERVWIEYSQNHPLVWACTDPQRKLAFQGRPTDGKGAILALYEAHYGLADRWIPCPYARDADAAIKMMLGGYGVLTTGPERLLLAYADALRPFGVDAYLMPDEVFSRIPKEAHPDIRALTLNGSFVVGMDFSAQCITELLLL